MGGEEPVCSMLTPSIKLQQLELQSDSYYAALCLMCVGETNSDCKCPL